MPVALRHGCPDRLHHEGALHYDGVPMLARHPRTENHRPLSLGQPELGGSHIENGNYTPVVAMVPLKGLFDSKEGAPKFWHTLLGINKMLLNYNH